MFDCDGGNLNDNCDNVDGNGVNVVLSENLNENQENIDCDDTNISMKMMVMMLIIHLIYMILEIRMVLMPK